MNSYIEPRKPGIKNENGRLRLLLTILLTLYVACASAYIPTVLFTNIIPASLSLTLSMAMPLAGIGVCILVTVSPKPIIPFCFIAAFILFFGINVVLSSVLCVFLILIAIYAYLFEQRLWFAALLANVLSLAALFFLSGSIAVLLLSLAFIPAALMLFSSFRQKKQRVASVVSISSAMALTLTVALLAFIYVKDGNLYAETLRTFFDSLKTQITEAVVTALTNALTNVELPITPADAKAIALSAITFTFNLLPAILAIVFFVISFVAHSLYISILSVTVEDKREITNAVTFKMSVTSAVIFIVSYLLALILSSDGIGVYAVAAQNLYTILFPGFTLVCFGFFGGLVRSGRGSCLGTLVYFAMFALLFVFTDVMLVIASFAGALIVIISEIKSRGRK